MNNESVAASPAAACAAASPVAPAAASASTAIDVTHTGLSKFRFCRWYCYHRCHSNHYRRDEYLFIQLK
jgi:hypothetical protein